MSFAVVTYSYQCSRRVAYPAYPSVTPQYTAWSKCSLFSRLYIWSTLSPAYLDKMLLMATVCDAEQTFVKGKS